jgi:hypothetical protein
MLGERLDDRQKRVGGESGSLVGFRVEDGGLHRHGKGEDGARRVVVTKATGLAGSKAIASFFVPSRRLNVLK